MLTWIPFFNKYNKEFSLNNMALYLNNIQNNVNNHQFQDTIIHSYNKQYFSNYDNAYETLANKIMLPGEVTFAYYYDSNSPSGQNAIFAVGPLTQGYNIVFKNSDEIDNIKNKLYETIADVNTSISYIENTIENKIIKNEDILEKHIYDISIEFNSYKNIVNTSINQVEQIYNTVIDNTTRISEIEKKIVDINNALSRLESKLN